MVSAISELTPAPQKVADCVGYQLVQLRAGDLSDKAKRSLQESASKQLKRLKTAARSRRSTKAATAAAATSRPQKRRPSPSGDSSSARVQASPAPRSPEMLARMEAARKAAGYSLPSKRQKHGGTGSGTTGMLGQ